MILCEVCIWTKLWISISYSLPGEINIIYVSEQFKLGYVHPCVTSSYPCNIYI